MYLKLEEKDCIEPKDKASWESIVRQIKAVLDDATIKKHVVHSVREI